MFDQVSRILAIAAVIILTGCTSPATTPPGDPPLVNQPQPITLDANFKVATGQTIYVPVYSYIYHDNGRRILNLATTLSIRNTDATDAIAITCVRYHNSNGQLVRQYLDSPIQLAALASTDFFIDTTDNSGGLGANFIVDWVAQTDVTEPIIEAVMIGSGFQQGISFISPGKVIQKQTDTTCSPTP